MKVFYNPNANANILSLTDVEENYRVTMETGNEKAINVHLGEDKFLKLMEYKKEIYYLDTSATNTNNNVTPHTYFIIIVSSNK